MDVDAVSTGTPPALTWQRRVALALLTVSFACVGIAIVRYPPLLAQPRGFFYVLEPVAALALNGVLWVWVPAVVGQRGREALRFATRGGMIAGLLWSVNHGLEVFTEVGAPTGVVASAPFFLAGFVLWGVAGGLAARRTGSVRCGLLAAVWSALLCVLLVTTFGLVVTHAATSRLEQHLAADPDFQRSQWSDLHAFVFANSFDAAFWHYAEAPIIAAVVGGISSVLATARPRRGWKGLRVNRRD